MASPAASAWPRIGPRPRGSPPNGPTIAAEPRWRRWLSPVDPTHASCCGSWRGCSRSGSRWPSYLSSSPAKGTAPDRPPPTVGRRGVVKEDVEVAVLNGTAVPGLAAKVGDDVEANGYMLGAVTNSDDYPRRSLRCSSSAVTRRRRSSSPATSGWSRSQPIDSELERPRRGRRRGRGRGRGPGAAVARMNQTHCVARVGRSAVLGASINLPRVQANSDAAAPGYLAGVLLTVVVVAALVSSGVVQEARQRGEVLDLVKATPQLLAAAPSEREDRMAPAPLERRRRRADHRRGGPARSDACSTAGSSPATIASRCSTGTGATDAGDLAPPGLYRSRSCFATRTARSFPSERDPPARGLGCGAGGLRRGRGGVARGPRRVRGGGHRPRRSPPAGARRGDGARARPRPRPGRGGRVGHGALSRAPREPGASSRRSPRSARRRISRAGLALILRRPAALPLACVRRAGRSGSRSSSAASDVESPAPALLRDRLGRRRSAAIAAWREPPAEDRRPRKRELASRDARR